MNLPLLCANEFLFCDESQLIDHVMIPLNPGCALFNSVNALCNVSFETCPLPAALADEGTPITT